MSRAGERTPASGAACAGWQVKQCFREGGCGNAPANGVVLPKLGSSARAVVFAFSLLAAGFAAGEARATDWVVNINDTGFDPIPAGGTVVYTIAVENEDLPTVSAPANTITLSIPANAVFEGGTAGDTITGCAPTPATGGSLERFHWGLILLYRCFGAGRCCVRCYKRSRCLSSLCCR